MKILSVSWKENVLKGVIRLPSSKSISNRLLMIRALSNQDFQIGNLSESDDTRLLVRLLTEIQSVKGSRKVPELDTGNAGTVLRFLTAYLSFKPGHWVLTGSERMKQRPIGVLVEALKSLGAEIEYLGKLGYPPLIIHGNFFSGNDVKINTGISSQFISALMLLAPVLPRGLTIQMKGKPVSAPYIDMTASLMRAFGARITTGKNWIHIFPGPYQPGPYQVESDWSAAAFWYEAAALANEVDLELMGLRKESLQGDAILPGIFKNFGIKTSHTRTGIKLSRVNKKTGSFFLDFTDFPDIALPVISTCAMLGLQGRFEGLKSLRIKETDRLLAIKNELGKIGVPVAVSGSDAPVLEMTANPLTTGNDFIFESYGDHRMAMSFAMLAMKLGTVRIVNPEVVNKSYPLFWKHLVETGFEIK